MKSGIDILMEAGYLYIYVAVPLKYNNYCIYHQI